MMSSKLLNIITELPRVRLVLMATAFWFVLIFNIERLDVGSLTGFNISNVAYGLMIGMCIIMLSFPNLTRASWLLAALALTAAYIILNAVLYSWERYGARPSEVALEAGVILASYLLLRVLNTQLLNLEMAVQLLVSQLQQTPLKYPQQEWYRVQKELRRASRFESQLGCVYCEIYQEGSVELSLPKLSDVHHFTSYIVSNHYHRVFLARSILMLLYKSDIIIPNRNGFLIFLPETNQRGTARFLSELASLIKANGQFSLLAGEAHYPNDGTTFDTLSAHARSKVQTVTNRTFHTPPESEISNAGWLYELDDDAEWLSQLSPSARRIFLSSRVDDTKARAGAVVVDIEKRLEIESQSNWVNNLAYQSASARIIYAPVKRFMDIALSIVALPLLLPVILIIAILIYLDDGLPITFHQERTGYGGSRFTMYKFRTMKTNAADMPVKMVRTEHGDERPVWPDKDEYDPRITRIGRVLRKTSLDEIPQLWNVLVGDMSLVGPRPTSWNVDMYTLLQTERLNVKPGITGLWQVSARESKNFDERLLWDVKYVERINLWLDIQIILRTISQILRRKGA